MPFDLSIVQILIVLVIALLVFGPKRLPEMARSIGKGIAEFKESINLDADARPRSVSDAPLAASQEPVTPSPAGETAASTADAVVRPGSDQPATPGVDALTRPGSDQPPTPAA